MNLRKFYLGRAIGFIVVVLLVLIYFVFFKSTPTSNVNDNNNENNIVCTTDAKECPDGSYVGRSGPKCEFAPCPAENISATNWLLFKDQEQNISWLYPEKLSANFISAQTWPPKVSISGMAYNCPVTDASSSLPDRTTERRVDNRTYCVTATSEGAAGSVFTDYTYSRVKDGKLINISFALRYPQCDNYDDPQKSDCKGERETFDLDSIIDKIVQSLSLILE